ncbi:MAG TPA: hypothetical protein VJL83_05755 [Patescibacteria group bacterium]|nr:hypothetical protein [Patescibacteria group bacterium]
MSIKDKKKLDRIDFPPLWQLDIGEIRGHNIETKGRKVVNKLLKQGWLLLHIYTIKYEIDGTWQERPMAIVGRSRKTK